MDAKIGQFAHGAFMIIWLLLGFHGHRLALRCGSRGWRSCHHRSVKPSDNSVEARMIRMNMDNNMNATGIVVAMVLMGLNSTIMKIVASEQ